MTWVDENTWAVPVALVVVLLATCVLSVWLGWREQRRRDAADRAQVARIVARQQREAA